jgi:NAD(P)-dependent dehydrogenase (short-subunit alcohol dehydrogenase family)
MKVAIVTGAGQGIGAACARELARNDYACVLMSPSDQSERLAKEIGGIGMKGSVTEVADLERLVDTAIKLHGRIDAVVNNTGNLARIKPGTTLASGNAYDPHLDSELIDIEDKEWHDSLDFYFLNVVRMLRLVTPVMRKSGGGAIVNISSLAALEPRLTYPLSSPIRAATLAFTKTYADRYAREGIRINNVLPGFMDNREFTKPVLESIPMARRGRMEELAQTVYFLLSPGAGYVTGQSILVDGGSNRRV